MDRETRWRLEEYRRNEAGPFENAFIDDVISGEFDRRELLRRASILGISVPLVGILLRAAGEPTPAFAAARAAASTSRMRVGIIPPPTGAIEPHTFIDQGGLETAGISGEFLTRATQSKVLLPELAVSWKPNAQATIWTFKLRPNVTFHTGQKLTADDVVTTWKRLASPGSQALSAIGSYLGPGGVHKVDDLTVAFHLNQPVSNFPYLTSSTTYQAIILPANYQLGTFTQKSQTTGAFMLASYTPGVGAKYNRFAGWWGGTAPLAGVDVTYYSAGRGCRCRAARRADRPDRPDPAGDRPRAVQQLERADLHRARRDASRDADAGRRQQPVLGQPGAPGDRADARPAGDHQDAVQRPRRPRQRLAVRAGLRAWPRACRSARRTSPRPSS